MLPWTWNYLKKKSCVLVSLVVYFDAPHLHFPSIFLVFAILSLLPFLSGMRAHRLNSLTNGLWRFSWNVFFHNSKLHCHLSLAESYIQHVAPLADRKLVFENDLLLLGYFASSWTSMKSKPPRDAEVYTSVMSESIIVSQVVHFTQPLQLTPSYASSLLCNIISITD